MNAKQTQLSPFLHEQGVTYTNIVKLPPPMKRGEKYVQSMEHAEVVAKLASPSKFYQPYAHRLVNVFLFLFDEQTWK